VFCAGDPGGECSVWGLWPVGREIIKENKKKGGGKGGEGPGGRLRVK